MAMTEQAAEHHTLTYRIRNRYEGRDSTRVVDVHATPEEIESLAREGYLVREGLLGPEACRRYGDAVDELVRHEGRSVGSWGIILRGLHDKHPAFWDLVSFPPTLSVARAALGPKVRVRGFTARVAYPGHPDQDTDWHFHQRVIPDPMPPLFSRPQTLDVLIYLDEVNEANGPLCVLPGSHRWIDSDFEGGNKGDLPDQVVLMPSAGSAVFTHGSLWHRALPTRADGTVRRMLILGYGPCWMQWSIYGGLSPDGLAAQALNDPATSEEMREILGATGYI